MWQTLILCLFPRSRKTTFSKGQNEDLKLKIRDNELEVVKKTNYLGLQIDCSLDWKEQIKAVSAKVSKEVRFLKMGSLFFHRKLCKPPIPV